MSFRFEPPTPAAAKAVHERARKIIDQIGAIEAEWMAEALLVYAQRAQGRPRGYWIFVTDDGAPYRISCVRQPRMED